MKKTDFYKHNHENKRAMQIVKRSSAIFYFINTIRIKTEVHFMNYWARKRSVSNLLLRLNFRKMDGTFIAKIDESIGRTNTYVLDINNYIKKLNLEISLKEGSVEIEILSKDQNLFIAYPAAIIRYISNDWHTTAHSSQRVLSVSSGDSINRVKKVTRVKEGNITIHNGKEEPFFIIHNGDCKINLSSLDIEITSNKGSVLKYKLDNFYLKPYQTVFYNLRDIVDYSKILKDDYGTYSLSFNVGGIFPRIIVGNIDNKTKAWSIDHSNFADEKGDSSLDVFKVSKDNNFKNLVFSVPNNYKDKWECFADIYPTYPGDNYNIVSNQILNNKVVSSKKIKISKKDNLIFPRIEFSKNLHHEVEFEHNNTLPNRFHMGIHYRINNGPTAFLTDGPLPHNTPGIRTRWLPIFENDICDNYLMIANRSLGSEKAKEVNFNVELYNESLDLPLIKSLKINPNESVCFSINEIFSDSSKFLGNKCGWLYMTSNEPQRCNIHYASVKNNSSIALDHAF